MNLNFILNNIVEFEDEYAFGTIDIEGDSRLVIASISKAKELPFTEIEDSADFVDDFFSILNTGQVEKFDNDVWMEI